MARRLPPHLIIIAMLLLPGCGIFAEMNAATNEPAYAAKDTDLKASFDIQADRGNHEKTLVLLALSGGGSRAAYWSGSVMLALEKVYQEDNLNLLREVDLISSVSGGSLPAAYYAVSQDPGSPVRARSNRDWDEPTVKNLMSRPYISRWFKNWFWPGNIARYWFTSYDRSDIMANTLADNLYDTYFTGFDLDMRDINPERPYLVLNATDGTNGHFGNVFTFTTDQFNRICSDLGGYEVARAVMATASFPAVFNYMTLRDYHDSAGCNPQPQPQRYVHVFDGGNSDNLGLTSVRKAIALNKQRYDRIVVILVDAYTTSPGIDTATPDARALLDYAVDFNFMDSTDALLGSVRSRTLEEMRKTMRGFDPSKVVFYHIGFDDVKEADSTLYYRLNKIATNFKIDKEQKRYIDQAVNMLMVRDNPCLQKIRDIVLTGQSSNTDTECRWQRRTMAKN
jgi:predicted acylesterase/phospholipase RssA